MTADQFIHAFMKGFLPVLASLWPLWAFIAALGAGRLAYVLYRWRMIARSGLNDIDAMSGRDLERYLEILFNRLGVNVHQTAAHGDFGAGLVASSKGIRVAIQAKRYRMEVGVKAVQEAVAAKGCYSCGKAMVVTNNFFTRPAAKLADRNRVELWDRRRLAREMASVGGKRSVTQALAPPSRGSVEAREPDERSASTAPPAVCAICGQPVPDKVRDYCIENANRFGGRILCWGHQRAPGAGSSD